MQCVCVGEGEGMQRILEFKDHLRDLFKLLFGCNLRRLMDKMSSVQSIQQLNND